MRFTRRMTTSILAALILGVSLFSMNGVALASAPAAKSLTGTWKVVAAGPLTMWMPVRGVLALTQTGATLTGTITFNGAVTPVTGTVTQHLIALTFIGSKRSATAIGTLGPYFDLMVGTYRTSFGTSGKWSAIRIH